MEGGHMAITERWKGTRKLIHGTLEAVGHVVAIIREEPHVPLAYLFGSRVEEQASPEADLDIALHTRGDFSWEDLYRIRGRISMVLETDRLDLVWLDKADPILAFEVIRTGKPIHSTDPDLLNEFELMAKKRYYDYRIYLSKHRGYQEHGLQA
jgi:predicted nucleotidyltransferase